MNRRILLGLALTAALARSRARAGQIDRRRVDHLDAGLRPVRPHPADVQGQDRHRREGDLARHRPGARHRAARRCRRGVRACAAAGGEIRRRRLRREAFRRDVQRLHPDRAEERSGRRQGQGHRDGAEGYQAKAAPFISRGDKSGTHAAELALWKAAGIDVAGADKGAVVSRDRPGHGRGAQHRLVDERLCAGRSRHVAVVQEPRRTRHRGRGRQAAVQPVRRHAGESRPSMRT